MPFFSSIYKRNCLSYFLQHHQSLNSIFPAVVDNSLMFIIENSKDLDSSKGKTLHRQIQNESQRDSDISWENKTIPFFARQENWMNSFFPTIDEQAVQQAEATLIAGNLPNIYSAWMYVLSLKNKVAPEEHLRILLQHSETFFKTKLVYCIISQSFKINPAIINELFKDNNPTVIFHIIRATLLNWVELNINTKNQIKKLIDSSLTKEHIAIRSFRLLSTFAIDYSHEGISWNKLDEKQKKEVWEVWSKWFPIMLKITPLNVFGSLNTGRFGHSMDTAFKYLEEDVGVEIINAWFNSIELRLKNDFLLDSFELVIADNLMRLTKQNWEIRKTIFSKLVSTKNTSFLLSNLQWILNYWNDLHSTEKNQVLDLFNQNRIDNRWIKCLLLTLSNPREEIAHAILGDKGLFETDIELFLSKFPEQLLRDCLITYCGFSNIIYYLGIHHNNTDFWNRVITYIIKHRHGVAFDICLQRFVNDGVNGFSLFDKKEAFDVWRLVCNSSTCKKDLTISLINNTSICSCVITTTTKMWDILIDSYDKSDSKVELINTIEENIEFMCYANRRDLPLIWKDSFIKKVNSIIAKISFEASQEDLKERRRKVENSFKFEPEGWNYEV